MSVPGRRFAQRCIFGQAQEALGVGFGTDRPKREAVRWVISKRVAWDPAKEGVGGGSTVLLEFSTMVM